MIELIVPFAIAGLVIAWVFGISPELEKRKNNTKVIEDFYKERENEKETKEKSVRR
jgi:hypothetical protein